MEKNQAISLIKSLIILGLGIIVIYSCKFLFWATEPAINSLSTLSLCVLIAGSALTAGIFIGFIFAIPKSVSNSSTNFISTKNGYINNDNLVEVSDWLTKIIIGVGLTQLLKIPEYMMSLGNYLGGAIGGSIWGQVAAESIIVYFGICGFLLAYLWTRLYFAKMLNDSEENNGDNNGITDSANNYNGDNNDTN